MKVRIKRRGKKICYSRWRNFVSSIESCSWCRDQHGLFSVGNRQFKFNQILSSRQIAHFLLQDIKS